MAIVVVVVNTNQSKSNWFICFFRVFQHFLWFNHSFVIRISLASPCRYIIHQKINNKFPISIVRRQTKQIYIDSHLLTSLNSKSCHVSAADLYRLLWFVSAPRRKQAKNGYKIKLSSNYKYLSISYQFPSFDDKQSEYILIRICWPLSTPNNVTLLRQTCIDWYKIKHALNN